MDETLLHAATLQDIYISKIYGEEAKPTFVTSFRDADTLIEIGVFLRPYLMEMLRRLQPHFDICIYTASERIYANAILDWIDPFGQFF